HPPHCYPPPRFCPLQGKQQKKEIKSPPCNLPRYQGQQTVSQREKPQASEDKPLQSSIDREANYSQPTEKTDSKVQGGLDNLSIFLLSPSQPCFMKWNEAEKSPAFL
ncbi:Hypothetical predicted protein, partial [Marmota monax]